MELDNNSQKEQIHKKKISTIREEISKITLNDDKSKSVNVFRNKAISKLKRIRIPFLKKGQNIESLTSPNTNTNNEKGSKLAVIKKFTPSFIGKTTHKAVVANQIALATFYRVKPQTKREKFYVFGVFICLLVIAGVSSAIGLLVRNKTFHPLSQTEYKYNIPFFFGGDSLWEKTPTTVSPSSSFNALHTCIYFEYSYQAANRNKQKTLYTAIKLNASVDIQHLARMPLPMDILNPFTIYIYNAVANSKVEFHRDVHNVTVPYGASVIKYTSNPKTSIYPHSYQFTDKNKNKQAWTCNEILSCRLSADSQQDFVGRGLYPSALEEPFDQNERPKPNIVAKQTPAFGIFLKNYVNFYVKALLFAHRNDPLNFPVAPDNILYSSTSMIMSYYFPKVLSYTINLKDLHNPANYKFDSYHYSVSSALLWQQKK